MKSMIIEQTEKETQLAISVHRNAEIGRIRLVRTKAEAEPPEETMKETINVSMDVKSRHVETNQDALRIEVQFSLQGKNTGESAKPRKAISIECAFEIDYRLRPDFNLTAEQINAFKDGNAIFNCWPYCREYVQEIVMKLGYPPITLPFLRVHTKAPDKKLREKRTKPV